MGDLIIATPFLQAASEKYAVTLLAKPYALDLQSRFWPEVKVMPFVAPWTAFKHKYNLLSWPWREILQLRRLMSERFDFGLSARWDPRDHLLLTLLRARNRLGFSRLGSKIFLNRPLSRPEPIAHRYESWRVLGSSLGFDLPARENLSFPAHRREGKILIHTGAGQPVRVWPLDRYRNLAARLRQKGLGVQLACDPDQRKWWLDAGETHIAAPHSVAELFALVERASLFIGNDSGPGHLAACLGVPTVTIFGPQLPEWFAPLHPSAQVIEGKGCPYKPCSDYCRFATPFCLSNVSEPEVWARVDHFVSMHLIQNSPNRPGNSMGPVDVAGPNQLAISPSPSGCSGSAAG